MRAASEKTDQAPRGPANELADGLIAGTERRDLRQLVSALDKGGSDAGVIADALRDVAEREPKLLGPVIGRLARQTRHPDPVVAAACGAILAELCKTSPAKVAKQIDTLTDALSDAGPAARDGIVHTFIALCAASVVYQRRLGGTLSQALAGADMQQLSSWAQLMLPTLKGEPYANAREIVEQRLSDLPRTEGQALCATIGVSYRGRRC